MCLTIPTVVEANLRAEDGVHGFIVLWVRYLRHLHSPCPARATKQSATTPHPPCSHCRPPRRPPLDVLSPQSSRRLTSISRRCRVCSTGARCLVGGGAPPLLLPSGATTPICLRGSHGSTRASATTPAAPHQQAAAYPGRP